jgi:hypothetical protein
VQFGYPKQYYGASRGNPVGDAAFKFSRARWWALFRVRAAEASLLARRPCCEYGEPKSTYRRPDGARSPCCGRRCSSLLCLGGIEARGRSGCTRLQYAPSVPACPSRRRCSLDVLTSGACGNVDASRVYSCLDPAGKPLSMTLCARRLASRGRVGHRGAATRPFGGGRAHQACIKQRKRSAAATHAAAPMSVELLRTKRPFSTLGPTQRWKRSKAAREGVMNVLQRVRSEWA